MPDKPIEHTSDTPERTEHINGEPDLPLNTVEFHKTSITTGPIPNPVVLAKYDEFSPGLAKEIVNMAKEQAKHRQYVEKKAIDTDAFVAKANIWEKVLGQALGFAIALITVSAGTYLVMNGNPVSGTFIGVSGVTGLAAVFVFGRSKSGEQQVEKNSPIQKKIT
jgi:uncharacterized membrane protein